MIHPTIRANVERKDTCPADYLCTLGTLIIYKYLFLNTLGGGPLGSPIQCHAGGNGQAASTCSFFFFHLLTDIFIYQSRYNVLTIPNIGIMCSIRFDSRISVSDRTIMQKGCNVVCKWPKCKEVSNHQAFGIRAPVRVPPHINLLASFCASIIPRSCCCCCCCC